MANNVKENLGRGETWRRGLLMLLFALLYSVGEVVLGAIVLFQFGSQLFIAERNERLSDFSIGLNAYLYQILRFLTYRSDNLPYPFTSWPDTETGRALEEALEAEQESYDYDDDEEDEGRPPPEKVQHHESARDDEGETETGV